MRFPSIGVKRGCGYRKAGGAYACIPLSPNGVPVWHFVYDPPKYIPEDLKLSAQGMNPIIRPDGVVHLIDVVGQKFYPYAIDFVEEVGHRGLSRRIKVSDLVNLDRLNSLLLLVHPKAIIKSQAFFEEFVRQEEEVYCPTLGNKGTPHECDPHCVGYWYHQFSYAGPRFFPDEEDPSFTYHVYGTPFHNELEYDPGFFMWFRMSQIQIEVIRGDEGEHESTLQQLDDINHQFPVALVDY